MSPGHVSDTGGSATARRDQGGDDMADNGQWDDPDRDNPIDTGLRGLMRGLRDLVTQIADPTAPPRPQPVSSPGRRPPRPNPRTVAANSAGAREPAVDVFDEGEVIRVVADMPGADPATLKVRGVGNRLAIAAAGPARRYERIVTLPAPAHADRAAPPTFINGIMEILLPADRTPTTEEHLLVTTNGESNGLPKPQSAQADFVDEGHSAGDFNPSDLRLSNGVSREER
jgi:HSP20 family molecular chaperone IbpA